MFTGFKVLRSRSEDRKKDNKKSSSKWSLDKALCQGNSDRVKESTPEPQQPKLDLSWDEFSSYAGSDVTTTRVVGVPLERDPHIGLGINLRPAANYASLVVTHIKPYGPADREGTIKVGDRVLAVDGKRLGGLSLAEAQSLLTQRNGSGQCTWLVIEYDVSVMSNLRSTGPLLIEIESSGELMKNQIGLSLIDSSSGVIVSKLKTASIAERCGAFLPGDQILAVNDVRVENSKLTSTNVAKILEDSKCPVLQIEILPVATTETGMQSQYSGSQSPQYTRQNYQDINDNQYHQYQNFGKDDYLQTDIKIESGLVSLQARQGEMYGIIFRSAPSKKGVIVCYIEPNSIADRSGVLQVGDRILMANGRPVERLNRLEDLGTTLHLSVQFDVEVWRSQPKENIKRVRLTRSLASGFGVTITDSPETGIIVSEVKWGSVAHRCGRIFIGDRLVRIDQTRVTDISVAMRVFKSCNEEVTFYLCPGDGNVDLGYSSPGLPSVDSAVESWDSSIEPNLYNGYGNSDWRMDNRQSLTTQQSDDDETCSSIRLSEGDLEQRRMKIPPPPPSPPCPLRTNYNMRKIKLPAHWRGSSMNDTGLDVESHHVDKSQSVSFSTFRRPEAETKNIFQVTLYKSLVFDDFGFSVSDGLYEKGVFINTIKPGSPADLANSLKPYDKIIKVNDIPTHDLDCCMTVPLMASAGKKLTLTVARHQGPRPNLPKESTWVDEVGLEAQPDQDFKKTETL
ncbi:glutamate receptor-interacting protein 2-like [Cimex lectularius]|uniref:PDZ domain-containing protein n=1 Tax=Cimex lectularius TaxID=79782 RepID=A0A8I6S4X6_CIMLE|nr:glutamate receptor-interacting protein 2-like [Cimex lectularius]